MENESTHPAGELDAIAEARAAIVRRSRTPRWYFAVVGVLIALLVLTIGLGMGTWWYLPAIFAVLVIEGVVIAAHRRVTGTSVPGSAWPVWVWVGAAILAVLPVLTGVALRMGGAPDWTIVAVAVVGGLTAGFGAAVMNRRWEATRVTP
ncbi:hypothetical protein [Microbacterium terricola]|nr:hypothetical protein [Microbacterium terricola]UYK41069.1 hypothetical protein OAU46_05335 [Microbacterium terricola]